MQPLLHVRCSLRPTVCRVTDFTAIVIFLDEDASGVHVGDCDSRSIAMLLLLRNIQQHQLVGLPEAVTAYGEGSCACSVSHHTQQLVALSEAVTALCEGVQPAVCLTTPSSLLVCWRLTAFRSGVPALIGSSTPQCPAPGGAEPALNPSTRQVHQQHLIGLVDKQPWACHPICHGPMPITSRDTLLQRVRGCPMRRGRGCSFVALSSAHLISCFHVALRPALLCCCKVWHKKQGFSCAVAEAAAVLACGLSSSKAYSLLSCCLRPGLLCYCRAWQAA